MVHLPGGLSFRRLENGAIGITFPIYCPTDHDTAFTVDPDTWCSLMAAMSAAGDTADSKLLARALHMERDSGAATERETTETADAHFRCPVCGSVLTMMSLAEDTARCLACLYFWAPSTRLAKRKPPRSWRDPITTITESRPIPLSVTDDL